MSTAETSTPVNGLAEICCGNELAIQFCGVFRNWCHWVDDVIDGDMDWKSDETIRVNLEIVAVLSRNQFFQSHKKSLLPLILQAFRAFGDSEKFKSKPDVKDRRAADILKSFYHEVIWHAGYLAAVEKNLNGWDHLSAMTEKYRSFNFDCQE